MIYYSFLLLNLYFLIVGPLSNNSPKCRNYQQACAFELLKFPALINGERDDINENHHKENLEIVKEGSGENADEEQIHFVPIGMSFPVYDEFVPTTPTYDYSVEPVEKVQQQVCSCLEGEIFISIMPNMYCLQKLIQNR